MTILMTHLLIFAAILLPALLLAIACCRPQHGLPRG